MSESRIQDLDQIFSVSPQDHFVLEHDNNAYNLTGQDLIRYLIKAADKNGVLSVHVGPDQPQSTQTIWLDTSGGPNSPVLKVRFGERWNAIEAIKGDPGILLSQKVEFQVGFSGTVAPSGPWSQSVPQTPKGRYLWTRVTQNWNSGGPVVFAYPTYQGQDGIGTVNSINGVSPDPVTHEVTLSPDKIGAVKMKTLAVQIPTSAWSGKNTVVAAPGVTARNTVQVSPAESSFDAYAESGIRASAQSAGQLTFTCKEKPKTAIFVNVVIFE